MLGIHFSTAGADTAPLSGVGATTRLDRTSPRLAHPPARGERSRCLGVRVSGVVVTAARVLALPPGQWPNRRRPSLTACDASVGKCHQKLPDTRPIRSALSSRTQRSYSPGGGWAGARPYASPIELGAGLGVAVTEFVRPKHHGRAVPGVHHEEKGARARPSSSSSVRST